MSAGRFFTPGGAIHPEHGSPPRDTLALTCERERESACVYHPEEAGYGPR